MAAADQGRDPLTLAPGRPVEIACDTKAVVVATDAAKATSGAVRLTLFVDKLPEASFGTPVPGTWRIVTAAAEHKGAFAVTQAETCRDGCPLSLQASGEIQLWAPKPSSIDQMGENDVLLLAIIKPVNGVLRASTFRGKAIEALEEGSCRLHAESAPGSATGPVAPEK